MDELNRLYTADRDHLWHPYNQMKSFHASTPIILVKGEGYRVQDIQGNEYKDGVSGLWNVILGYGRQQLAEAAYQQLLELPYANLGNFSTKPVIELAQALASITPDGIEKSFFCSGGAEAVDTAIKMARQYHLQTGNLRKTKIITYENGYHGCTFGALSATGTTRDRIKFEPLVSNFLYARGPRWSASEYSTEANSKAILEDIERIVIKEGVSTIAAVLIEPVLGSAGIQFHSSEYFKALKKFCQEQNVLLIFDEVTTGFGRVGELFASKLYGVTPDIMITSKAITNGYFPFAAVSTTNAVYDAFWSDEKTDGFMHGFTNSGSPAGCAVALEVIKLLTTTPVLETGRAEGERLRDSLKQLQSQHRALGDVRGVGVIMATELIDPSTLQPADPAFTQEVVKCILERGFIVRAMGMRPNVIGILPPLVIDQEFVQGLTSAFDEALSSAVNV